jgi:hypothetical protein
MANTTEVEGHVMAAANGGYLFQAFQVPALVLLIFTDHIASQHRAIRRPIPSTTKIKTA